MRGSGADEEMERATQPPLSTAWLRSLMSPSAVEFFKFCVVGLSGVGVNLGLYAVGTREMFLSIYVASPLAIEASVIWNFLCNDRWTFRSRVTQAGFLSRLGRFHLVCLSGAGLNYAILLLLATVFGWWDMAANLAGIVAAVALRFGWNSSWTWRERLP